MWRDELEQQLRVSKRCDSYALSVDISFPPRDSATPRTIGSRRHVHLEVHSLDAVEALFALPQAKHERREQERLGVLEGGPTLWRRLSVESFYRLLPPRLRVAP